VDGKGSRSKVVAIGEPEDFRAFLGGGHGTDADVPPGAPVAGGDHIPLGSGELYLHTQSLGDLFGYVYVKAIQLARVVEEALGGIVGIGGHHQFAGILDLVQKVFVQKVFVLGLWLWLVDGLGRLGGGGGLFLGTAGDQDHRHYDQSTQQYAEFPVC
jgi:hypothetical protein